MKSGSYWFLLMTLVGLGLFFLALRLSMDASWNEYFDDPPYLTGGAFISYCASGLLLSHVLTYLFCIPKTVPFKLRALDIKQQGRQLVRTVGKSRTKKILLFKILSFALLVPLFNLFGFLYIEHREIAELQQYGQSKKVQVNWLRRSMKGQDLAVVSYEIDHKVYTRELVPGRHRPGEWAIIIYSVHTPGIVRWADELHTGP